MTFKNPKVARMLAGALGLLLALSLVLVPTPALAVPGLPHQFYGTVTIGTAPAPEGTIVSARIGGVEYLSTTVDTQGRYGYAPLFQVPADDLDTPQKEGGVAGETVEFYITNLAIGVDKVKANETRSFEIWGVTELNLTVTAAGVATKVRVETAANGSGVVVPAQSIASGTPLTVYAITRDASNNFVANVAANAWSLQNSTGGVAAGDLVPSGDMKSAVFTGHAIGSAQIKATSGALATTMSGVLTVTAAGAFNPWIYDTNKDGVMSKDETLGAVNDYLAGNITKDEALEVVKLYFS